MTTTDHIEGNNNFPLDPSTIENIDLAMFEWLDKEMDIYSNTNKGWKKTPVIWMGGERGFQVKNKKELRDNNNTFVLPLITLERTDISKDLKKKGRYYANIPPIMDGKGGSINIVQEINQDKTSNFANADSKRRFGQANSRMAKENKVVYVTKSIPLPIYVSATFVIELRSEYQQQMNEMLQPFMTFPGGVNYFIIENEGHRYEAFMKSDYSVENNVNKLGDEARMFHTKITVEVLGHLVGKGANQDQPKVVMRENIVEVKINREYVIFDNDKNKKKLF